MGSNPLTSQIQHVKYLIKTVDKWRRKCSKFYIDIILNDRLNKAYYPKPHAYNQGRPYSHILHKIYIFKANFNWTKVLPLCTICTNEEKKNPNDRLITKFQKQ